MERLRNTSVGKLKKYENVRYLCRTFFDGFLCRFGEHYKFSLNALNKLMIIDRETELWYNINVLNIVKGA